MKYLLLAMMSMTLHELRAQALPEAPEAYYDFWLGSWNASWDEGDGKVGRGTNRITYILDSTVIHEDFRILEGQSKGFKGTSISTYQKQLKTWKQAWADNQTGFLYFLGKIDGNKRIFQTPSVERPDGTQLTQRMVFYDIQEDSFMWDWETSKDGGESWTLNWRITYERREDPHDR